MDFFAFFEHSPELLAITDAEGSITRVNPAWQKILGFDSNALLGQSLTTKLRAAASAFKAKAPTQGRDLWIDASGIPQKLQWTLFPLSETQFGFSATVIPRVTDQDAEMAQLYRAIIDHSDLSIIATDVHGVIQSFNSTATRFLGFLPEEVMGNRVPGIVHDWNEIEARAEQLSLEFGKPVKPGFETLVARPRDYGMPDEHEWTYIRKDGSRFPVMLTISAIRDGNGRIIGYVGVGKDITALKKAEAKFEETRHQLENFLEALPIGVYVIDHLGVPYYANEQSRKILGKGIIQGTNENNLNEIYQAYIANTNQPYPNDKMPLVRGLSGEESFVSDMVIRNNEGTETPLEVWGRPVFDSQQNLLYSIAAFIDVSDRIQTQKKLKASLEVQQKLNGQLNQFSDNLKKLHATLTNQYDTIEAQFEAILKTGVELLNLRFASFGRVDGPRYHTIAGLYPPEMPRMEPEMPLKNTYCHFIVDEGSTITFQEFSKVSGASVHPAYQAYTIEAFIGTPVKVNGQLYGTLSFSDFEPRLEGFDRHEKELIELMSQAIGFAIQAEEGKKILQNASQQLVSKNEELTRINEELDQFAYVVSHDLKAPLRAINNIATWLEEDLGEQIQGESREHLSLLRNRVGRMDALISGILAYSRAGRKKGTQTPNDLKDIVREAIDVLQPTPRFQIIVPEKLPTLFGDRTELIQVFTNLIGNAIKYNHQAKGHIEILYKKKGNYHQLGIKDDGPGIAPAFHERIFGVFQRLEGRDEIEGTGVGLSIVRKVIEVNGGKIWVESEEGKGAIFYFTWPVGKPAH